MLAMAGSDPIHIPPILSIGGNCELGTTRAPIHGALTAAQFRTASIYSYTGNRHAAYKNLGYLAFA